MKLTPQDLDAIYAETTSDPTEELIDATATEYGLNPALLRAVIGAESSGNPAAVSPKGAQGLMQLMPDTAKRFGVTDPLHPGQNLRGGAQYLKTLIGQFPDQPELVLAAYNAGEGAVAKHGGVPPYPETQAYVKKVMGTLGNQPLTTGKSNGKVTVGDLESLYQSPVTVQDLEGMYGQAAPEPGILDTIKGVLSGFVSQPAPGQAVAPDMPVEAGIGQMPTVAPPPTPDVRQQAVQQAKQDSLGVSAVPVTTPPQIQGPVADLPVESGGPTMAQAAPMPFPERLRTMQQSPNVLERLLGGGVAGALAPVEQAFRPPSEGGTADIAARAGEIIFAPVSAAISGVVNALVQSGAISQQFADRTLKDLMGATPAFLAPEAGAFRAASKFRKGFRENQPAATVPPAWQTPEAQDFLRRVSALRDRVVRGATPSEQAAASRLLDETLTAYGITVKDLPADVTTGLPKRPLTPQGAIPERAGPSTSPVAPEPPVATQQTRNLIDEEFQATARAAKLEPVPLDETPAAPPTAPTAPPVRSEVPAATPQPPKVETPTAAPVVAQAESKAAPLGRIEPKSVPVSQSRIQELVDAGVDPARAKAQAVDEATSGRGPKTTLPPEIAKMAEEERAASVVPPRETKPQDLRSDQQKSVDQQQSVMEAVQANPEAATTKDLGIAAARMQELGNRLANKEAYGEGPLTEAEKKTVTSMFAESEYYLSLWRKRSDAEKFPKTSAPTPVTPPTPPITERLRTKAPKPAPVPPEDVIAVGDTISDGLVHGKVLASGVMRMGKKDVPAWQIEITSGRQKGEKSIITKQDAVKYTPPAERTAVEPTKEPWQMTREEFSGSDYYKKLRSKMGRNKESAPSVQFSLIRKALEDGKPVPANVLAEYPDLQAKPPVAEPPYRHSPETITEVLTGMKDYLTREGGTVPKVEDVVREWNWVEDNRARLPKTLEAVNLSDLIQDMAFERGRFNKPAETPPVAEAVPPKVEVPATEPVPPKSAAPVPITERLRTKPVETAPTYTPPEGIPLRTDVVRRVRPDGREYFVLREKGGTTVGIQHPTFEAAKAVADTENIRLKEADDIRKKGITEREIERLRAENARLKGQETPTPSTIEALQKKIKAQEAKINGPRAAMVPPPIRAEQQRYLTKLRDQLDAEIAKQETPNVNPPRTPAGATVPEVPEAVGAAGGRVGGAAGAGPRGPEPNAIPVQGAGGEARLSELQRLGAEQKKLDREKADLQSKLSQADTDSRIRYKERRTARVVERVRKANLTLQEARPKLADVEYKLRHLWEGRDVEKSDYDSYVTQGKPIPEERLRNYADWTSETLAEPTAGDTPQDAFQKGVALRERELRSRGETANDYDRAGAGLDAVLRAKGIDTTNQRLALSNRWHNPLASTTAEDLKSPDVVGLLGKRMDGELARSSTGYDPYEVRKVLSQELPHESGYPKTKKDWAAWAARDQSELEAAKKGEGALAKARGLANWMEQQAKDIESLIGPTEATKNTREKAAKYRRAADQWEASLEARIAERTEAAKPVPIADLMKRFDTPDAADDLARKLLADVPKSQIEEAQNRAAMPDFPDYLRTRPDLFGKTFLKTVEGVDPSIVQEAVRRIGEEDTFTTRYEPRKYVLTKNEVPVLGDRTHGIADVWGDTIDGRPIWFTGHFGEFGEPPKGLRVLTPELAKTNDMSIPDFRQVIPGSTPHTLTPIARETTSGGLVILRRDDGQLVAIKESYWDHFTTRHPGSVWTQPKDPLAPVVPKVGGIVQGIVMPMRYENPSPVVQELLAREKGVVPPAAKTKSKRGGGASVGPGAQSAEEFTPAADMVTSTKNAIKNLEREARGLEPTTRPPTFTNQSAWDQALKQIEEDAGLQDRLIAELVLQPRALTPVENGVLLHRSVNLINERNDLATQLFRAVESGFEERTVKLKADLDRISDEMLDLDRVLRSVGTESGRSLQARKMMVDQDYTLLAMETRKRIAKGGAKLSDAERAEIKVLHDRIASLTAQLETQATIGQAAASAQHATKAVQEMGQRVAAETTRATRTGTLRDAGKERSAILEGLERASEEADLADLRPWIQKLAESFVREGITTRDPLVKAVHGVLVDLFPEITLRQTMDAISGFGDFRPLNPDPIKTKLRDLKGQMQQVAKLENLHAHQPLPKTGVERRVPSDEERRLIQMVEEAKRRYGVTVTDPERQLKSALDAIKTRLRHEITDLEYQIATKQKFVKTKSPAPTDPETVGLRTQRDTLKAHFDELFGVTEKTPEQRTALAIRAVERSIIGLSERIANKEIAPRHFLNRTPITPELTALRARQTALREQLQELRDLDTSYQEQQRLRTLERSIADYERRVTTGDLAPAATTAGPDTPAIKAATARRDAARAALDALRESSGYADALRVQRALAALEDANAELSRKIREHDLAPKAKGQTIPDTPEILRARAEHQVLSDVLQKMREAERPRKTPEEIALQTLKTRMAHKAADLAEKLTTGQFQTPPRREILLDLEGKRLRAELDRVTREFHEGLVKDRLARRSRSEKVLAGMGEALNLPRFLMTSFDLSAVLRQGGFIAFGHPLLAAKTFPDMFRALWSKAGQHAIMDEILTRPNAALYHKAGLYLSDLTTTLSQMEEAYMSRWATHIPGLASSQRAYVSFLNRLRADAFDTLVRSLRRGDEVTLEEAKAIANYINVATGRGKIGIHSTGAVGLNSIFFSPRYLASRFQLFGGQPFYHGTGRTRKKVATEYGRFLLGAAVVYALAKAAGSEIETDPRSSDFGKIRFGKTRIDPMGGLLQVTTLLSRLVTGETKTLKGTVQPIRGSGLRFGQDDTADLLARFLRTKLSPNVGLSIDVMTGKSVTGDPVTPTSAIGRAVVPMAMQDIYESLREQGVPKGSAMGVLAIFGMGLSTYEDRQRPGRGAKKPGMVPTLQEILKRPYDRNRRR